MFRRKPITVAKRVVFLLILSALLVAPALAQFGLIHFAPREVKTLPVINRPVELATVPPEAYSDVETLEKQAGFSVLQPGYLPVGCALFESNYLAEPIGEIDMVYRLANGLPCFSVTQRKSAGPVHRPYVEEGSVDEVTVHGLPAIYIDGMWRVENLPQKTGKTITIKPDELFETATWMQGPKQLIFEYNDILIRIDAGADMTKEELIRIAESME